MLLPLQGDFPNTPLTQGVALGWCLIGPIGRRYHYEHPFKKVAWIDHKNRNHSAFLCEECF